MAYLKRPGLTKLKVKPDPVQIATEAAPWGSIAEQGLLDGTVIVSDGAGQFRIGEHALCRVHAERLIHKLDAFCEAHVQAKERNPPSHLAALQGAQGFGNAFKHWCREADLPQCNCHGLRKIGAVRAVEAGASEHELMAMFGWEDADMARIYTRKAAQKKLAASGAAKVSHARIIVPPPAPPLKNMCQNNDLNDRWRSRRGSNPQPPA